MNTNPDRRLPHNPTPIIRGTTTRFMNFDANTAPCPSASGSGVVRTDELEVVKSLSMVVNSSGMVTVMPIPDSVAFRTVLSSVTFMIVLDTVAFMIV